MIEPTLDDVLSSGRFEIISIGFVIALWSGSRALNVFVDTITIMYGLAGQRGLLRTRALSFVLYLVFLVAGVIVLPLVLAGPGLVDGLLPDRLAPSAYLYWPVVLVGTVGCPGHALPPLRSGADPLASRAARRRPDPADLAGRQRAAPGGPGPPSAGRPSSTVRWPPRSPC